MLTINRDQKRLPFGGHHFYEEGLMIRGESAEEVAGKLEKFRINNNRPAGNPLQDVLFYYSVNFPWMVKREESEAAHDSQDYVNWRNWLQSLWVRPPKKILTTKEATFRWDVCKSCPFNVPIPESENQLEQSQVKRKAFMLRRGVTVPPELGFCSLHHFDLGVATFIEAPKEHSEKQKDARNPLSCWV